MPWEPPALTTLLQDDSPPTVAILTTVVIAFGFSALAIGWLAAGSEPLNVQDFGLAAFCFVSSVVAILPRPLLIQFSSDLRDWVIRYQIHAFVIHQYKMVLTLGAFAWLGYRSFKTLLKPVPDLISVLGVDVPEAPDVSLAGIRSDAATLSWTRPSSNRPVQTYSIQVNGVHVGDSPGQDLAITVTGLKPNHFYNVRVVAVGPNNFRTGSAVIRLRTYGRDGKPDLGNSRLPTNFSEHDDANTAGSEAGEDVDAPRRSVPTLEVAPSLDANSAAFRDANGTAPPQRRNTINRRHSPSVASMDQPRLSFPDGPEQSLAELTSKFEEIRAEIEETAALYAKDEAEFRQQEDELKKEKERKRQMLRDREEQTAQLKAMMRLTQEQMRGSEKERAKREQQLKDKETKKLKVRDNISKLEGEVERMKTEMDTFEAQKAELGKQRDCAVEKLDEENDELQEKCAELEAELKEKGKQLQDLKEAREQLPGADDEPWKEGDVMLRREWENKRKDLHNTLVTETKKLHQLDQHIRLLEQQVSIQSQSSLAFFGNNHAESPSVDFDNLAPSQSKRLSHNSTHVSTNVSPPQAFGGIEQGFPNNSVYGQTGFYTPIGSGLLSQAKGPSGDLTDAEAEIRSQSGPMSPSIVGLLPSFLLQNNDPMESRDEDSDDQLDPMGTIEDDPQSPASSKMSFPAAPSPHASTHSLAFPQYGDHGDGSSLNINSSPRVPPASGLRLSHLLQSFQRGLGSHKPADEGNGEGRTGPLFGTLKPGQSQSFPRGTEDGDGMGNRRRMSFSWMSRPHPPVDSKPDQGTPSSSGSRLLSSRRFNLFGGSSGAFFGDRDTENSRPVSIASTDLPRPSTDSNSIWGPADSQGMSKHRLWSSSDNRWASRSGSRRPSLHGSPAALTTTLASADDEILDERDLLNPQSSPSQVGVIGSRPPGASSRAQAINRSLNPNAPTFINTLFGFGKDSDKDANADSDRGKGKEKDRSRDKGKDARGKGKETTTPSIELSSPMGDDSPSDSRLSRDTFSVHTQTSVSESHESLPLDSALTNAPSEFHVGSVASSRDADSANAVRKLFRKGSSSKFSFSSRLGKESGLFKKGPGSTHSDKAVSADHRSSIGDLDDLGEDVAVASRAAHDSATSSPALGPAKARDAKESRIGSWRRAVKKKGKESLDLERAAEDE